MLSFTIINIVFYLLFSQVANAYWLHASCLTLTNADQVEAQIKEAFKLADEMADMFKGWQGPDNLDADSKRLFNLLVGGDGNGFNASGTSCVSGFCVLWLPDYMQQVTRASVGIHS